MDNSKPKKEYSKEELTGLLSSQMLMSSYVTTLFIQTIIEKWGDEGRKTAEKIMYQHGVFIGDHLLANGHITKMGMEGYAQFIDLISFVTDIKKEVIKITDDEMIIKAHDCPVGMMIETFGSTHDICHILTQMDLGVCKSLGFEAEYTYDRKISIGDTCCDYQLKKK